jgi:hypothetical protein
MHCQVPAGPASLEQHRGLRTWMPPHNSLARFFGAGAELGQLKVAGDCFAATGAVAVLDLGGSSLRFAAGAGAGSGLRLGPATLGLPPEALGLGGEWRLFLAGGGVAASVALVAGEGLGAAVFFLDAAGGGILALPLWTAPT